MSLHPLAVSAIEEMMKVSVADEEAAVVCEARSALAIERHMGSLTLAELRGVLLHLLRPNASTRRGAILAVYQRCQRPDEPSHVTKEKP